MNCNRKSLCVAVAAATLGLSVLAAHADAPSLPAATVSGAATTATFSGGATSNNGSTYITTVSSTTPVDLLGTINVAPADVGKTGALVALVQIPNMGAFQMLSGGFFIPWNGQVSGLLPYRVKTLSAQENITLLDDLIGAQSNLTGLDFEGFFGYYTNNDINTLAYTWTPAKFTIADAPAEGCPTNTTQSAGGTFDGKPVCILTGTITSDTHLTSNNVYLLDGGVFIGGDNADSATLTIDAGTKVISPVGLNFLVINRGSKISANGTASAPIIFTYDDEANATATTSGRWGGLIINGNAPVNGCAEGTTLCEIEGEGSTGLYGGNDPADNSGNLNYVVVKYAGQNITETNELNGIAFQGVGNGTVVDYIQVHNNSDDGVEFFGGTVNAKHIVLTGNEDDSFDWTFGWSGKVQHVVIAQREGTGDRAIEADNNEFNFDALPRSKPSLANFTFIGKGAGGRGIELRRGTGANIANSVLTGFDSYCIDLNDNATFINGGSSATALNGNLTITGTRFGCAKSFAEDAADPWSVGAWFNGQAGNSEGEVTLNGFINSPAINALSPTTLSDSFFDQVDYIGAVKNAESDWTAGWTHLE